MAPPTPQRTPTGRALSSSTFPCTSRVLRPSACHLEVAPTTTATDLRVELIADSLLGSTASARPCRCAWARSVEGQDGARDLARLHRAEGLIDVVEAAAAGDHLVEEKAALAIEVEVPQNVDAEAVAAHAGGLHATLGADGHPGEFDPRVRRQDADDGGGAADGQALDGLTHEGGIADGVVVRRVDGVGRADASGHLELAVEPVERDDLPGTADARPLHNR